MQQKQLSLALTNLALFHAAAFTLSAQKEASCVMFKPMAVPSVNVSIILLLSQKFLFNRRSSNENATYNWQQQEHILSAILLLPEFHCSRKLISIVSRSHPLPASRPVSHLIKTQYFLGSHNVEERTILFRFSTFFINNGRLHEIVWQGAITTT